MSGGRLVVLEGLDGCGKSTLARSLADRLDASLLTTPCFLLRKVRELLEQAYANGPLGRQLFYTSTVMAASEEATAVLGTGRDVVVDRYLLSTLAYASLRDASLDLMSSVVPALRRPDLTVWVGCSDEERRRRMGGRGALGPDDALSLARAAELRTAYAAGLADPSLTGRVLRLDSTATGPEALVRQVLAAL